jgi:hypothetical protein
MTFAAIVTAATSAPMCVTLRAINMIAGIGLILQRLAAASGITTRPGIGTLSAAVVNLGLGAITTQLLVGWCEQFGCGIVCPVV